MTFDDDCRHEIERLRAKLSEVSLKLMGQSGLVIKQANEIARVKHQLIEAKGCFDAADAEGLQDRLAEADLSLGTLGDLVQRRLAYAYHHIISALGEP